MTIWSVEKHPKNLSLEAFSYLISENNIWIIEENILSKLLNASYILHKKTYRRFTSQKKKQKTKKKQGKLYCSSLSDCFRVVILDGV